MEDGITRLNPFCCPIETSNYSKCPSLIVSCLYSSQGVDEVAAAVQDFSIHVKKEGEGLRASLASLRETEVGGGGKGSQGDE